MKRIGIAILVLLGLGIAAFTGLMAWANSEFTWCYARFDSVEQAEAALRDVRAAAPDAGVDMDTERRGSRISVIFESGESGSDAQPFRRAVAPAVRKRRGTLGHPGDGCLERGPFM